MIDAARSRKGAPSLVVLQSVSRPSAGIDYTSELERHAPTDVHYRYFNWPRAILGRYDLLHMHWPEYWIRNAHPVKRGLQTVLFPVLLARLAMTRTPVVRTLHNVTPHEQGSRLERMLLGLLDRLTTVSVRLNKQTPAPQVGDVVDIPHGDFNAFRTLVQPTGPRPGRVLFFGHVRRYKAVPQLVAQFGRVTAPDARLRVTGSVKEPTLEQELRRVAEDDPRVSLDLRFIADEDLAREVNESTLVALPYEEMHNSGAVFVALSLGRPVLVPASSTADEIAAEVGERWVHRYRAPLSSTQLEDALRRAAELLDQDTTGPDLSNRSWPAIAQQYRETYFRAVKQRRRRETDAARGTR